MKEIFKRLNDDYEYAKTIYNPNDLLGIFAYSNDTQTRIIKIPSFEEVCTNDNITDTIIRNKDHIIYINDLRLACKFTDKGHPNIIEALYTNSYIINPKYEHLYNKILRINRDKIVEDSKMNIPANELKIGLMTITSAAMNENSMTVKFIKQITDAEKVALQALVNKVGDEGVFSQAKVASAAGISKLTMSNLINKLEEYGLAKVEALGPKGTYIKLLDSTLLNIKGE